MHRSSSRRLVKRPPISRAQLCRGSLAPLTALALLMAFFASPLIAHEVPSDVTVQMIVKPDRDRLSVLVRLPLEAMQDMNFPVDDRGILDLDAVRASSLLDDAAMLWVGESLELLSDGIRLDGLRVIERRLSLPSDRSFRSFDQAVAHIGGTRLAETVRIPWRQALLDVHFEAPLVDPSASVAIQPELARLGLRVRIALQFLPYDGHMDVPGGSPEEEQIVRVFDLRGNPGLVQLDPRLHQAALRFVALGFEHILDGIDHLLFLGCLVIPLRRLRQLIVVVTAFTVAHSITLIAAAYGLVPGALWFPSLVELLIAASIVYMAFENILGLSLERRWLVTFGFGLIHGFGFSFVLRDSLQFAGSHLVTSLLAFNVGVELGQLFVLCLLVPLLDWLFHRLDKERLGVILLSAVVAHTGWHWMTERAETLAQYSISLPLLDGVPRELWPWITPLLLAALLLFRQRRRKPPHRRENQRPEPDATESLRRRSDLASD